MNKTLNLLIISIACGFLNSSCSFSPYDFGIGNTTYLGAVGGNIPVSQLQGPVDSVSFWDPSNASGKPLVKINLKQQRAKFYKGSP